MGDEKASEKAPCGHDPGPPRRPQPPHVHDFHAPQAARRHSSAPTKSSRSFAPASKNTRTTTSRSTTVSKSSCPISRNRNITSRTIAMVFWNLSLSIPRAPLPFSTKKPPPAMNSSAPCTRCPSAPPKISSTPVSRSASPCGTCTPIFACLLSASYASADWTKFGLKGSIATEDACSAAGGRFHPVVFGWMVHVYPYEQGLDNIFAMHHHMD